MKQDAGPGLRLLTEGLFDYAGTFPPAALPFEDALRESAAFPKVLGRPWLVAADMVVTAGQLGALTDDVLARAGFSPDRDLAWAVLGPASGPDRGEAPHPALRAWLEEQRTGSRWAQRLASYEIRLEAAPDDLDRVGASLSALAAVLDAVGVPLVVEPDWTPHQWRAGAAGLASLLAGFEGQPVTLKVRASGPKAVDSEALAVILGAVVRLGLPFKATAGLHHPVRSIREGNDLGFLSLAAALRFRQVLGAEGFPDDALRACLEQEALREEEGAVRLALGFDRGLAWGPYALGEDDLAAAVAAMPFTVGSCSLGEPDEDLARAFGA